MKNMQKKCFMRSYKVAVILPIKNDIDYFPASYNSLIKQTYSDFDIYILSNGSSDASIDFLENYPINKRTFIVKYNDIGLTATLNYGLRQLSADKYDLVIRMDSDDICSYDRVEKLMKAAEIHSNADLIFSRAKYIGGKKIFQIPEIFLSNYLVLKNNLIHPTVMFVLRNKDKNFKIDDFLYDEKMTSAQDYELWTRGTLNIKVVNNFLLEYRVHDKQISKEKIEEQIKNHFIIASRNLKMRGFVYNEKILNYLIMNSRKKIDFRYLLMSIKFIYSLKSTLKNQNMYKISMLLALLV